MTIQSAETPPPRRPTACTPRSDGSARCSSARPASPTGGSRPPTPTTCSSTTCSGWTRPSRPRRLRRRAADRGVEVVELHDVLAETLAVPGARDWLLDRKIVPDEVGLGLVDATRGFLEGLDAAQLAEYLIGGLATHDLPDDCRPATSRSPESGRRPRVPDAPAAEHALHPRHDLLALRRGHAQPAVLAGAARRDAADEGVYQFHPDFVGVDGLVGRPETRLGPGHARGRRRHAGGQRHGAGRA